MINSLREQIAGSLGKPAELEALYRHQPKAFREAFLSLAPELGDHMVAQVWLARFGPERVKPESDQLRWGGRGDLLFVVLAGLTSGFLVLLPEYFPGLFPKDSVEEFLSRNVALFVMPFLMVWFWRKNPEFTGNRRWFLIGLVGLIALVLNLLPNDGPGSTGFTDTLFLAIIHAVLLLWALIGFVFTGGDLRATARRTAYLRFNGDLVIMISVLSAAWGLLSAMTMGLFSLIGINLQEFYFRFIFVHGIVALPLVGTYVVTINPGLVDRVSPLVARIFSPAVLVMLVFYLVAMAVTGKNPYDDREFLLTFNLLLIGVMALILFAVSSVAGFQESRFNRIVLLSLAAVTVVVNAIALSAILYRIGSMGVTPNRLAVMGSNVLMLVHLVIITRRLYVEQKLSGDGRTVEEAISKYLPFYAGWTAVVTFIFPVVFGFR